MRGLFISAAKIGIATHTPRRACGSLGFMRHYANEVAMEVKSKKNIGYICWQGNSIYTLSGILPRDGGK
jgi:hypothetical protein